MLYKLINEYTIIPCPENGVSQGDCISNLPLFYTENPQRVKIDGYKNYEYQEPPTVQEGESILTTYTEDKENIYVNYSIVNC